MTARLPKAIRDINVWLLAPVLVATLTYVRTLTGDFVWDDEFYLQKWIVVGNSLYEVLFPGKAIPGIPYYRPLANLYGLVLYRLSDGGSPWLWHASNVLVHVVSTVGVYALLRSWIAPPTPSASQERREQAACIAGATLFACWPANVEAIVWISARTEGLMVCLLVWAMSLHLRARDSGRTSLPAAALFFLALCSKETAIVFFPLAAAATVLLPPSRGAARTGWRAAFASSLWLPYVLAYVVYAAIRRLALGKVSGNSLASLAADRLTPEAVEPAVRAWSYYLREALLLGPGSPFTELPPAGLGSLVFGIAGVVAGTLVIAMAVRPSWRPWSMAVVWFVLGLGPPIAMAVDPLSVTAVAMRYLYASSVALAAVAALIVVRLPDFHQRKRTVLAVACVGVVGLMVLAQIRMSPWLDALALWTRAVDDEPYCAIARMNLGLSHVEHRNFEEGEKHLRIAAYGSRGPIAMQQGSLIRLAEFYVLRGELQPARVALLKATTIGGAREGIASAMTLAATLEMLEHKVDGSTVSRVPRNRLLEQVAQLESAAALSPLDTSSRLVLAILNEALGEKERARSGYLELSRIAFSNATILYSSLARAERLQAEIASETDPVKRLYFEGQRHETEGDPPAAIRSYEAALALAPERSDLLLPLAELEAKNGNLPRAVELMARAVDAEPRSPFHWFNLGLYRSLLGDLPGSSAAFARASELQPKWWRPFFHRAAVLEAMGDPAGAADQYEHMLAVFEGVEPIREHAREKVRDLRSQVRRNSSPDPADRQFLTPP